MANDFDKSVIVMVNGQAPFELFVSEKLDVCLIGKESPPRAEHWNSPFTLGWSHDPASYQDFYRLDEPYLARLRTLGGIKFTADKARAFKQVLDTYWNKPCPPNDQSDS